MSAPAAPGQVLEELAAARDGGVDARRISERVRWYLAVVRDELARIHREGGAGRAVNELHSERVDALVRRLVVLAEVAYFEDTGAEPSPVAVVAVGGYARQEMAIHSDVDLLVLHEGELSPYVAQIAERLQYWLWDAGVTVGCATRSIPETVDLARRDETVYTAILDTRFLAGAPRLFHTFSEAIGRELLSDVGLFIDRQIEAMRIRHMRYGDSLYLLQPNLKEGVGGLRDYHAATWTTRAAYPATRGLDDLLHFGLLTESEMKEFLRALDFLWRARNELHLLAGRKDDRMSFEHQERIAEAFGYAREGEPTLPVERFMGEYYRNARAIGYHSDLVVEQCRAHVRQSSSATKPSRTIEDGFRLVGDHLEVPHAGHLRERPVRLLEAFAVAQDHDVDLSRSARRMIRENLDLVDDALRRSSEAAACLQRILSGERRVMRTLVAMNEVGLLGRYLPEWEHIVCRWQHVLYHTYTVDVHSIFLVEELRRLWRGKYERALPELTELVRAVDDRPVLFLGCLLHDIGKGFGGNHSNRGAERARHCVERLGLEPERAERVVFLVRHHLLMSHLAQRRDLTDPKLLLEFARTMGNRVNLRNLYLLTFADVRASSPSAWSDWKGMLLRELFERASEILETGTDDPSKAFEKIEARVETRQRSAREALRGLGVADSRIGAFFESMPRRYFVAHTPRQIARHARALLSFIPERVASVTVRSMKAGFSEVIVCSLDVHGLYARVAGTLTARGINILASNVYTTRSGMALEVYRVGSPPGGAEEQEHAWATFEETLRRVLSGETQVDELLRRRRRPVGAPRTPSQRPPNVTISNEESDFYTIVDVSANDRLGLLYDLTRTLTAHDLEIYLSKAATVMDQVADSFYVKNVEGKKLTDPQRLEALRRDLFVAAAGESDEG